MRRRYPIIHARLSILAALASVLVLLAGCPSTATPAPTAFDYLVRVRDPAGAALRNAKVTVEVPGRAPLDDFADVNGLVVITIPATYVDQAGKLIVEAAGFEIYRQNITLQAGQLPDEVRLSTVIVLAPTDTATPVLSPTPPPTASATPTAAPSSPPILNLRDGDLTSYSTSLLGEYPAGLDETIRVFVVPPPQPDGTPSNLYPQSYNHCRGNEGASMQEERWEQHILVGLPITRDVGLRFDLVVTTAADAGNAAVVTEIQRWCDDAEKKWLGFPALPAGVEEVERITVIRSDELVRAPDPSNAPLPGALRISSPRDGQTVADEQVIRGIYSGLPDGHAIWILVYTVWGKWLPQSSDACAGLHTVAENGQWQVTANFETSYSGEPFDVVAVVADAEASAFFDRQQRQWCAQAAASPDFRWPGLLTIELPAGITEKDRIQLFHQ